MGKIILLADMESFYASVEMARNPELKGKPVVVCGDPKLRHGITLAASREAKAHGIKTGMPAWKCQILCPTVIFVRPHMQTYIDVSLKITDIFYEFTDRILPYSIDEQFLDMTGCEKLFGTPREMALRINKCVQHETGIRSRIGIGDNPLQAKMACDCFAKRNEDGIFQLSASNYSRYAWPLPIKKLFGVGSRMEQNLYNIGVKTIGDLTILPIKILKDKWGVTGEVLWLNAHGIDYSIVETNSLAEYRGIGHSITLPRDYSIKEEIEVVLLELTEEVCRRARSLGKIGNVIHLYCRGAGFDNPTGFSRQKKLPEPTAVTMEAYPFVMQLFYTHWDRMPVRAVGMSLSQLVVNNLQLSLFEDKEKRLALSQSMDDIRKRFGGTSLFRASSLTTGGLLFERANKIGGHEA